MRNHVSPPPALACAGNDEVSLARRIDVNNNLQPFLQKTFVDDFDVCLRYISCSTLVHPVNKVGLSGVEDSIRSNGWIRHCALSISISQLAFPDGDFSQERINTVRFKVLDGNHRVEAAKKIFGLDEPTNCRVFQISSSRVEDCRKR